MALLGLRSLAGIEYRGLAGITEPCKQAVLQLLQYGDAIVKAHILSCAGDHALILETEDEREIAIKTGFGSGYMGEGSRGFSCVLAALYAHRVNIDEYVVSRWMLSRVDSSSLTNADLANLRSMRSVRGAKWHDYIFERDWNRLEDGTLWQEFNSIIPFGIIDPRIIDLARTFWEGPDEKLLTGYRRLEDTVRTRAKIEGHGAKLFSEAFENKNAILHWKGIHNAEKVGRVLLFKGGYMTYRNRRAHREMKYDEVRDLREFLLLNHLFVLEAEAEER